MADSKRRPLLDGLTEEERSNIPLLLEQLLYFPSKTVHDDGPNALEGGAGLRLFEHLRREYEEQQPPAPAAARQQLPQPFPLGGRA